MLRAATLEVSLTNHEKCALYFRWIFLRNLFILKGFAVHWRRLEFFQGWFMPIRTYFGLWEGSIWPFCSFAPRVLAKRWMFWTFVPVSTIYHALTFGWKSWGRTPIPWLLPRLICVVLLYYRRCVNLKFCLKEILRHFVEKKRLFIQRLLKANHHRMYHCQLNRININTININKYNYIMEDLQNAKFNTRAIYTRKLLYNRSILGTKKRPKFF